MDSPAALKVSEQAGWMSVVQEQKMWDACMVVTGVNLQIPMGPREQA
ncbi:MAG: hypothetical protein ACFCU3_02180 [Verrucomicrobiales bacterium]